MTMRLSTPCWRGSPSIYDATISTVPPRKWDRARAQLERGIQAVNGRAARGRIKVHTLRRDAVAVARRVEELAGIENPAERPAWRSEFRARRDAFASEGETKGINFSLSVAIEMARLMLAAARSADERGTALNLLGNALWGLGERESGTARLEEAVEAYRAALTERTRERVPLDWAGTQNNLGNALASLGERESGTARLEEAVAAYRAALTERTRERVPLDWAGTQNNLGPRCGGSASARAAPRGWRRRSPPIVRR